MAVTSRVKGHKGVLWIVEVANQHAKINLNFCQRCNDKERK